MLSCPRKTCCIKNAGFRVDVTDQAEDDAPEYNLEVVRKVASRIDYQMFYDMVGHAIGGLPPELPENYETNQEFLHGFAHVLYGLVILEGSLTCNICDTIYPITDGIPRMRLPEEELDTRPIDS